MTDPAAAIVEPAKGPVLVNMVAKHAWGPNPRRVVRFVVLQHGDELVAEVHVARGNSVVLEERFPIVSYERTSTRGVPRCTVVLPDGSERVAPHGGCGCGSPLKHWRPAGAHRAGT